MTLAARDPMTLAPWRWTRRATRLRAVLAAALALVVSLVLGGGIADAHAQVRETAPADGQVLESPPTEVSLTFNEGVKLPTAGLRVFDGTGERVDAGDAMVDPANPDRIVVGLREDLGEGTYVVTWRAVSADGHPIKGAWLWSVGAGDEVGEDLVATLFQGGRDRGLAAVNVLVRGLAYGGVLLLGGAALFWLLVQRHCGTDREHASLARVARRAGIATALASVAGIPLQAMLETGLGLGALAPAPLLDVVTEPVGIAALLRTALAVLAVVLLAPSTKDADGEPTARAWPSPASWLAVAAPLTLPLDGHSLTQDPVAVIFAADVAHVLAAAAWGGGLVALWLVVRQRRRADDPVGAAEMVAGFSRLATAALVVVVVAGSAMAWVTVRSPRTLTATDYGWTLVAKLVLVGALVLVGLYNNRRLVPAVAAGATGDGERLADGAWVRLRQTLRIEVALVIAITLVTGLLVGQQPAAQEAGVTGAFTTYVDLTEDVEVNLVVDPNRAGLNEVHVYLLDRTGRPVDAEEVRFVLELPAREIGPLERIGRDAGPGHWSLVGRELAVPGEWDVTVVVRTSRFAEERVTVPVVVNG